MRILVTGGAGFQGSHIVESWVNKGNEITVLNTYSPEAMENTARFAQHISLVWGSVTDREIVEKTVRGHDVVLHLAAHINVDESLTDPRGSFDVNVGGTLNVLEAIRQSGARMIFASTCEVYGQTEGEPMAEDSHLRPHSPYAASKAAADRVSYAYYRSFGLNVTIVRPGNVYGNRQKSGRGGAVIPIFANSAVEGRPLRVFGDGEQRREYVHVDDLVRAYDLVLARTDLAGEVLNVGTGETPSIQEIAEFISTKTGADVINEAPRPGEVPGFDLNSSKIKALGFDPQVKFWDGLSRYLEQTQNAHDAVK